MKRIAAILAVAVAAVLAIYGSKPVTAEPDRKEIAGVWECSDFPSGFLAEAGAAAGARKSRIVIGEGGSCSASNMPQRDPYRFIDVTNSLWTLTDPSMTPSGAWSVEFDGEFLQCRRSGGRLELRYLISGMDEYSVTYKKTGQAGASNP